jgi:hypothetical protein
MKKNQTRKNENRTIYCADTETWAEAREIAKLLGTTVSVVILDHLREYVRLNRDKAAVVLKARYVSLTGKSDV